MKSKKGIDIVTSVGTRLYDAFVNASTSGTKRVVTTVGTGAGPNQMAMQNDTTIVDAISVSEKGASYCEGSCRCNVQNCLDR